MDIKGKQASLVSKIFGAVYVRVDGRYAHWRVVWCKDEQLPRPRRARQVFVRS